VSTIQQTEKSEEQQRTVQLKIIHAPQASLQEILFEELATKNDHLIKQYVGFRSIMFSRCHWFKKGLTGKQREHLAHP
jgi:hypothetical protein